MTLLIEALTMLDGLEHIEPWIIIFVALTGIKLKDEKVSEGENETTDLRGSLKRFPDFFRMGTFIDSTHMKL